VAVVDSWDWEVPSTKDAVVALSTLGLTGRVLVVLSREDERAYKSFRNISGIDLVLVPELNAYDVLCSDWVVFTRATLPGDSTWGEAPAGGATTGATAKAAEPAQAEARASGPAPSRRRAAAPELAEDEVSADASAETEPVAVDEPVGTEQAAIDDDATEEPVTEEQSDE
jgi:large subunit ribosomal protein L4